MLLPPCYRHVVLCDFTADHADSYNDLVEAIRRNLLTADWCDENHKEVCVGGGGGLRGLKRFGIPCISDF